jgi:ribulose-phosphate 3-epimerase
MKIKIAPSILSADFSNLQADVDRISSADILHIDVMDGHFVSNITIGPLVIKNLKTRLFKDVHLMVNEPEKFVDWFATIGVDSITFHAEAVNKPKELIQLIKSKGIRVGVSLNPNSPIELIKGYVDLVDMVLIMTVFPGKGGQSFLHEVLPKIKDLRKINPLIDIEVDGGINESTIKLAYDAGANIFVAGNFIFNGLPQKNIELLRKALV